MKKIAFLVCALLIAGSTCVASNSGAEVTSYSSSESYTTNVSYPTGVFFNGSDFVKVADGWVRIYINQQSNDYSITASQMDPSGNYVIRFGRGETITIYPNGRALYYNDTKYAKK